MFSYKQIISRLREKHEVKLSDEDFEILLFSKVKDKEGVFTQIKRNLIECNSLETEIPQIGKLFITSSRIKLKVRDLIKRANFLINEIEKEESNTLRKEHEVKLEETKKDLFKYIQLWVKRYNVYELDALVTKKGMEMEKKELKDSIYIDPIVKERVERLLSEPKLTLDRFIFEMKQINTPITKAWFLVAYQLINELLNNKTFIGNKKELNKKAKMTKAEFKLLLEKGGLYVTGC